MLAAFRYDDQESYEYALAKQQAAAVGRAWKLFQEAEHRRQLLWHCDFAERTDAASQPP
jgi:hypothetical protein